jgi:hypothetical protein
MTDEILSFLNRLDAALTPFAKEGERFDMFLLGRSALVMLYGFTLSTRDIDVVGRLNPNLDAKALELFGKDSATAASLGIYLDPVPQGLPPLPHWYRKRAEMVPGSWSVLRLWKLEVHDLAATKLKSFRAKDRQDLQALCDRGFLTAARLRESLEAAFPLRSPKAEDAENDPDSPDWGTALANLRRVEAYLNGEISSI